MVIRIKAAGKFSEDKQGQKWTQFVMCEVSCHEECATEKDESALD
jgi:hypothetical protein